MVCDALMLCMPISFVVRPCKALSEPLVYLGGAKYGVVEPQ